MNRKLFSIHLLNNYYPALHGLRFIAIFGVIQNHACFRIILNEKSYFNFTSFKVLSLNLWYVMDLFFFMSGFLISLILFNTLKHDEQHKVKKWLRFYVQRGFRIFPLYYAFLLIYWISIHFTNRLSESFYQQIGFLNWRELTFLTNYPFDPKIILAYWSWSLSAEEHFYLFCPLFIFALFKLKKPSHRIFLISFFWLSGCVVRWFIVKNYGPSVDPTFYTLQNLYTPTHTRYDIFFAGVLLGYFVFYYDHTLQKIYNSKLIRYFSLFSALAIFSYMAHPQINPIPPELDFAGTLQQRINLTQKGIFYFGTLTGVGYILLVSWCIYTKNFVTQILSLPLFRTLATLGYGIYLVHIPVLIWISQPVYSLVPPSPYHFQITWLILSLGALLISIFISYIMHLLIEKPFLFLRSKVVP